MPSRRQLRVAEQIHREISSLLLFEAKDPRLAGVTITGADVSPDLMLARVYFSVLGTAEERAEAQAGLEHARRFLRTQVAERIQQRFAPDIVFKYDGSGEYGRRIDALLDQLTSGPGSASEERGGASSDGPGTA